MAANQISQNAVANSGSLISDSWRRCRQNTAIEPSDHLTQDRLEATQINQRMASFSDVLGISASATDYLRRVAKDADLSAFIADRSGIVLRSFADSPGAEQVAQHGLVEGSVWDEWVVGTNGLGTCIVSKAPIVVAGQDHYLGVLHSFVCAAAPILSPTGDVMGVIDVAGFANTPPRLLKLVHSIVKNVAADLERTLFYRQFGERHVVRVEGDSANWQDSGSALIGLDDRGRILGITGRGRLLHTLGDRADWVGRSLAEAIELDLADLMRRPEIPLTLDAPGMVGGKVFLETRDLPRAPSRRSGSTRRPAARASASGRKPLDRVAGSDRALQDVVRLARRLLKQDLPLIVLGETGTGKDTFAKALHAESDRHDKPFVAVNCAALPPSLLDTELFGYAPGTFTGGLKQGKLGKVASSDGGTLFLDEIGDMPVELQTRLLHVLESRSVAPLGSAVAQPVDIRVVAATNKDLPGLVKSGAFREDLYYRLCGAQVRMPALRERTDLKELVATLIEEELTGESGLRFDEPAWETFACYPWPGNIRQLRNTLKLLTCLVDDGTVRLKDLPDDIRCWRAVVESEQSTPPPRLASLGSLRGMRAEGERQLIEDTLAQCGGHITAAAAKLGISRATMHRKLQKYRSSASL